MKLKIDAMIRIERLIYTLPVSRTEDMNEDSKSSEFKLVCV